MATRLLPRFAVLYGMKVDPMAAYCYGKNWPNKLPRGMDRELEQLRPKILNCVKAKQWEASLGGES